MDRRNITNFLTFMRIHLPEILIVFLLGNNSTDGQLVMEPNLNQLTKSVGDEVVIYCTNVGTTGQPEWTGPDGQVIGTISGGGSSHLFVEVNTFDKETKLQIVDLEREDEGTYTCRLSGTTGQSIQIFVFEDITFTKQDEEQLQAFEEFELASIKCTVMASPAPTIEWYQGGVRIFQGGNYYIDPAVGLTISNITREDEATYTCRAVIRSLSESKSMDIFVDVQVSPTWLFEPSDETRAVGSSVEFHCRADGDPPPDYTWKYKNNIIQYDGTKYSSRNDGEYFTINDLEKSDDGSYVCEASNAADTISGAGELTVLDPPRGNDQQNETVTEGQTVRLYCTVVQGEDCKLKWFYEGREMVLGHQPAKHSMSHRWPVTVGGGQFELIQVTGVWYRGSSRYVIMGTGLLVPPFWTSDCVHAQDLHCTNSRIVIQESIEDTQLTLTITGVLRSDGGGYTCELENEVGISNVTHYVLLEYEATINTTITKDQVFSWVGNPVNVTCHWEGYPTPSVIWKRGGWRLNSTDAVFYNYGNGSSSAEVTPSALDFGSYVCEASNRIDTNTHTIDLVQAFVPSEPLGVSEGEVTSTTLEILFEVPLDDGNLPIIGYRVEYWVQYEETYTMMDFFNETEEIKLINLNPSQTYYFRMAAENDVGFGKWSENATAKTIQYRPPRAPTIISPDISTSPIQYELVWRAPEDNGGSPIIRYIIRHALVFDLRAEEIPTYYEEQAVNAEARSHILYDLKKDTHYFIELFAVSNLGDGEPAEKIIKTAQGTLNPTVQPSLDPTVQPIRARLNDDIDANSRKGILELTLDGGVNWYQLCDRFSHYDSQYFKIATVVCKQLGYGPPVKADSFGRFELYKEYLWYNSGWCDVNITEVPNCSLQGSSLTATVPDMCPFGTIDVECLPVGAEEYDVALVRDPAFENNAGVVLIHVNGQWGPVCEGSAGDAVCEDLGYGPMNEYHDPSTLTYAPPVLGFLNCDSIDKTVEECDKSHVIDRPCNPEMYVRVSCMERDYSYEDEDPDSGFSPSYLSFMVIVFVVMVVFLCAYASRRRTKQRQQNSSGRTEVPSLSSSVNQRQSAPSRFATADYPRQQTQPSSFQGYQPSGTQAAPPYPATSYPPPAAPHPPPNDPDLPSYEDVVRG